MILFKTKSMFFVRQKSNQCGLHAIQNMLKTAAIDKNDMQQACETIHERTGDPIHNHETFGGDWSSEAVLQALHNKGFDVQRVVSEKHSTVSRKREWSGPLMENLLENNNFRGFIIHQPVQRHFTCIRPEIVDGEKHLYYVDSQSSGPIRISSRLAMRRCLASAYAWEPYIVKGEEMEYVAPTEDSVTTYRTSDNSSEDTPSFKPSAEFMKDWHSLNGKNTPKLKKPKIDNIVSFVDDTKESEVYDK